MIRTTDNLCQCYRLCVILDIKSHQTSTCRTGVCYACVDKELIICIPGPAFSRSYIFQSRIFSPEFAGPAFLDDPVECRPYRRLHELSSVAHCMSLAKHADNVLFENVEVSFYISPHNYINKWTTVVKFRPVVFIRSVPVMYRELDVLKDASVSLHEYLSHVKCAVWSLISIEALGNIL